MMQIATESKFARARWRARIVAAALCVFALAGSGRAGGPLPPVVDLRTMEAEGVRHWRFTGRFSNAVCAGDVNGDSYRDLLLTEEIPDQATGVVWLILGSAKLWSDGPTLDVAELPDSTAIRIGGSAAGDTFGYAIAFAGDVNGDTFDDFLVGAPQHHNTGPGTAYLFHGAPDWGDRGGAFDIAQLDGANGFRIASARPDADFGHAVAHAGDLDGDNLADIVIGAPAVSRGHRMRGGAYVIFGSPPAPANAGSTGVFDVATDLTGWGYYFAGGAAGEHAGWSVASAGLNHYRTFEPTASGLDGAMIGGWLGGGRPATAADPPGTVRIVTGRTTRFGTPAEQSFEHIDRLPCGGTPSTLAKIVRIVGANPGDNTGFCVAGAGNLGGFSYDRILFTLHTDEPDPETDAGDVYLHDMYRYETACGSAHLSTPQNLTWRFRIGAPHGDAPQTTGTAGDLNGDGRVDLFFGDPALGHTSEQLDGTVWGLFSTAIPTNEVPPIEIDSLGTGQVLRIVGPAVYGARTRCVGDLDLDGGTELALAADPNYPGDVFLVAAPPAAGISTHRGHAPIPAGRAPRGFGEMPNTGAVPLARWWMSALDGFGAFGADVIEFHATSAAAGSALGDGALAGGVMWRSDSTSSGVRTFAVVVEYLPREVAGLETGSLGIYQAISPFGPWTRLPAEEVAHYPGRRRFSFVLRRPQDEDAYVTIGGTFVGSAMAAR